MSLRIEIKNCVKNTRIVTSTKTGVAKDFTFHTQPAYVTTYDTAGNQNPYPEMVEIDLKDNQEPFPVGFYQVLPQSFYVGDFKKLTLGALHLAQIASAVPATAADYSKSKAG